MSLLVTLCVLRTATSHRSPSDNDKANVLSCNSQCNQTNNAPVHMTKRRWISFGTNCKTRVVSVPPSSQSRYKECVATLPTTNAASAAAVPEHGEGILKPPEDFCHAFLAGINLGFANMIPEESFGSIENR